MTVEELESRRRSIVINMFETIYKDACIELDAAIRSPEFQDRANRDLNIALVGRKNEAVFIESIRKGGADMVDRARERNSVFFKSNLQFTAAIQSALDISVLARSKLQRWLEDPSMSCGAGANDAVLAFRDAHAKLCGLKWEKMELARADGSDWATVQQRTLDYCVAKGWVLNHESINTADTETGRTPIAVKCLEGDAQAVRMLLDAGASGSSNSSEALLLVADMGRPDIMEILLNDDRVDVDARDKDNRTAAILAARHSSRGHIAALEILIRKKADINISDNWGNTPLSGASYFCRGELEGLRILIESKANLEIKDIEGRTPLFMGILGGQSNVVEMLLEAKANVETTDNLGHTPMQCAESSKEKLPDKMEAVIELLCKRVVKNT